MSRSTRHARELERRRLEQRRRRDTLKRRIGYAFAAAVGIALIVVLAWGFTGG